MYIETETGKRNYIVIDDTIDSFIEKSQDNNKYTINILKNNCVDIEVNMLDDDEYYIKKDCEDKDMLASKLQVGSLRLEVFKNECVDDEPLISYIIKTEDEQEIGLNQYEFNDLKTIIKMIDSIDK